MRRPSRRAGPPPSTDCDDDSDDGRHCKHLSAVCLLTSSSLLLLLTVTDYCSVAPVAVATSPDFKVVYIPILRADYNCMDTYTEQQGNVQTRTGIAP